MTDWWKWECPACGWKVLSKLTVNYQQAVARVLVELHIEEHEHTNAREGSPTKDEGPK